MICVEKLLEKETYTLCVVSCVFWWCFHYDKGCFSFSKSISRDWLVHVCTKHHHPGVPNIRSTINAIDTWFRAQAILTLWTHIHTEECRALWHTRGKWEIKQKEFVEKQLTFCLCEVWLWAAMHSVPLADILLQRPCIKHKLSILLW